VTLSDLKEQLTERLKEYGNRIAESETFISLNERFHNLSPLVQKCLIAGAVFLVGFLLYTIPASYVGEAQEAEERFTTNRTIMRDLYRVARNPSIPADRFQSPDFNELKTRVDALLTKTQVLDSQKGTFAPAKRPLSTDKVPSEIHQDGLEFEVKRLNLKQVVALSEQLSSIHPNTKLAAVQIDADQKDGHYFNVKYTLASLSAPIKESTAPKKEFNKKKK